MKSYKQKLLDPRWQRKRLEVLNRARFECEDCGSGEDTLHVHHSYYERGVEPWDYPDESLHCLCAECHKAAQNLLTALHRQLGKLDQTAIGELLGYANGLELLRGDSFPMLPKHVGSYEQAQGIGMCWGVETCKVIEAVVNGEIDDQKLHELSNGHHR